MNVSNNIDAQDVDNGTIPQITKGPVVPKEVGTTAKRAQLWPTEFESKVDDLFNAPKSVGILSQHFDAHSEKMVPKITIVVRDRKVLTPLIEFVFEDDDNFERGV